jgi:hypothetical protein
MSVEDYVDDPLWTTLVETVHTMVMYPHHKAYVRNVVIHDQPEISFRELAVSLGISFGEALVILHELKEEKVE